MSSLLVDNENIIPVYPEALLNLSSCSKYTVFREYCIAGNIGGN